MRVEHLTVKANGLNLHMAAAGPNDGKLVMLLHGFPEFWYGWKEQIVPLAEQGFRVLALDQRGYNLSDKPEGADHYVLDELRDDVLAVMRVFQREKAIIIGHDWGGAVGWHLAVTRPEHVEKFIAINMPHPAAMPRIFATRPLQWFKSSYMAFFQIQDVSERSLAANDYRGLTMALTKFSQAGTFSPLDVDHYKEAWAKPGALTGMLNWYRALTEKNNFTRYAEKDAVMVHVPTKIIWGIKDQFLLKKLAQESTKFCTDYELVYVDDATHWVHHEQPEIVNRLLKEFLKETSRVAEGAGV
ncbi:alpha/beta hydrolase [Terribacillus sp. 7520-G]|uniref:alpha/beta fold hydrolase n=1 Tax=Terribacillus TaxID=459532 RepID=UPI000BA55A54|nr:alpha/beta hydrolase [Terribacillus sp. 7520-G]PAD37517.1 alpha/beta hydrolase [Terribacillus sp. 7520-G]